MTVLTSVASIVIAIVGTYLAFLQHRRGDYERAERLLDYATTGEVAHARHLLGSHQWIRDASASPAVSDAEGNVLVEALFRLAWAFDRIYIVRSTVHGQPRRVIDAVLSDWVLWWGADGPHGCRYGRVAQVLGALDKEEHEHLGRLVGAMVADSPARTGHRCETFHDANAHTDG